MKQPTKREGAPHAGPVFGQHLPRIHCLQQQSGSSVPAAARPIVPFCSQNAGRAAGGADFCHLTLVKRGRVTGRYKLLGGEGRRTWYPLLLTQRQGG